MSFARFIYEAELKSGRNEPEAGGFTLIELMIVVAIIAIIASIAVPNLLASRLSANEAAAIGTLKNIATSEAQCQASGIIDADANGAGEYAYFGELSGRVAIRGTTQPIAPPILSAAFGNVQNSRVARSGYLFQVYLPDASANGIAEATTLGGGVGATPPDPARAEIMWCCYAWPAARGGTGNRSFFVNQTGALLSTAGAAVSYSGTTTMPVFSAAYAASASALMTSRVAASTLAHDGNTWVVVQ